MSHTRRRKEVTIPLDERRIAQVGEQELEDWELSEQEEEVERLIGAIEALPSQEKALITMFYYNGFSSERCAEITEQSVANVKTKLHRIRKKLYLMVKS
jgi:RNA polymerase sigma-70 factor (ECF subfamily)